MRHPRWPLRTGIGVLAAATLLVGACTEDDGDVADPSSDAPDVTTVDGTGDASDEPALPAGFEFEGALVSHWSAAAAQGIDLGDTNTMPLLDPGTDQLIDDVWFWDVWPVRDTSGDVADIDGWTVLMGLSADITGDRVPGDRHALAEWRAVASRDGDEWTDLGPVFADGEAIGGRQWAGSTVYDPESDRVTMYYTALGDLPGVETLRDGPASTPFEDVVYTGGSGLETPGPDRQEIVEVSAGVVVDDDGPRFEDFGEHEIVLVPDGQIYRTAEQARADEGPYVFRDPWWHQEDGREYLLFAASPATAPGTSAGVVGLATRDEGGDWYPLPPILSAQGVNSQLERPHLLPSEEGSRLFISTHGFSFTGDVQGPAGLYGFAADELRGRYTPMNDTGLVMANPSEAPQQAYSWVVVPTDAGPHVLSFVNYVDLGDVTLSGIGEQSTEWQRDHFGGSPAPLVPLEVDDTSTTTGELVPLGELAGG